MPDKYWEDFDPGFHFQTPSITVTETHVVNWAGLTMDFYPLHTDEVYAQKTVFKGRIAPGPLIFGLAVGLAAQAKIEGGAMIAWMGTDNMRMFAPVKPGVPGLALRSPQPAGREGHVPGHELPHAPAAPGGMRNRGAQAEKETVRWI